MNIEVRELLEILRQAYDKFRSIENPRTGPEFHNVACNTGRIPTEMMCITRRLIFYLEECNRSDIGISTVLNVVME